MADFSVTNWMDGGGYLPPQQAGTYGQPTPVGQPQRAQPGLSDIRGMTGWGGANDASNWNQIRGWEQQYGWNNDQVGQQLGFTGSQVQDNLNRYNPALQSPYPPQQAPQQSYQPQPTPQQDAQSNGGMDAGLMGRVKDYYGKYGFAGGVYTDPQTGQRYQSNATQGTGADNVGATDATEYYAYNDGSTNPGQSYNRFNSGTGQAQGQGQFIQQKMEPGEMLALGLIGGGAAGVFSGGAGGVFGIGAANTAAPGVAAQEAFRTSEIVAQNAGQGALEMAPGVVPPVDGAVPPATPPETPGTPTPGGPVPPNPEAGKFAIPGWAKPLVAPVVTAGLSAIKGGKGNGGGGGSGGGGSGGGGGGSGGGGGGGSGDIYTPTNRAGMDQSFQDNYRQFGDQNKTQFNNTNAGNLSTFHNQYNNPAAPGFQDWAARAGRTYEGQADLALGAGTNLYGAGDKAYQAGFDPEKNLYNKNRQDLIDGTRAAQYARGVGMTPYGAGVEGNVLENFQNDWQDRQLERAGRGINMMGQAYKGGAGMGNTGAAMQLAAGQTSYDANNTIYGNQNAAIQNYWNNIAPYMSGLRNQGSDALGYMNGANAAAGLRDGQNNARQNRWDKTIEGISGPVSSAINNIWGNNGKSNGGTYTDQNGWTYDSGGNPVGYPSNYPGNNPSYDGSQPYMPDNNNYTPNY